MQSERQISGHVLNSRA